MSGRARQDLLDIGDFIARDSPARARSFIGELRKACLSLARSPFRFAQLSGFEAQGYRRRVHGNYLILYRVTEEAVIVLRIVSAALDLDQMEVEA